MTKNIICFKTARIASDSKIISEDLERSKDSLKTLLSDHLKASIKLSNKKKDKNNDI